MQILIDRLAADGDDFLDGDPKRLLPDLYYLGEFHGAAVYGFLRVVAVFPGGFPGRAGLRKWVNSRLEQLGVKPEHPTAVLLTSCDPVATAGLQTT